MMQSSPADDDMEIWATVLADPLADGATSCSSTPATLQIDLAYVDYYDAMAIQRLLQGTQDEHDLDILLEGAYGRTYDMTEASRTHEEVPATTQLAEKDGACAVSVVDLQAYIPKSNWRRCCGLRGHRKRRISTEPMLLRNHFGDVPSTSKERKHGLRTNNKHWTLEEVAKLVDGVEEFGVGRWARLKKEKFSTSAPTTRTAEHLKDKWRNLQKAYKVRPSPKKKGNEKRRFLLSLDKTLIKRIQKLAAVHPYPISMRRFG